MAVDIYEQFALIQEKLDTLLDAAAEPEAAVAVPSYFRPGTEWDAMLAQKPALTVINPGSGPGLTQSLSYVEQVRKCKAAGVKVLGYVHTKYAARPLAEVQADIAAHKSWYQVDGIFIDTTSNRPEHAAYYAQLYTAIKQWNGICVLNPGTKTVEVYAHLCDHLMVCETDAATYLNTVRPAWEANWPADKFWHCIHSCGPAQLAGVVGLAQANNAGLIYVTDDVMTNPYDRLPSFWLELCGML
jgi:hypothetical protein